MEIVKQSLDAIIKKTVRYLILNLDLRNFFLQNSRFPRLVHKSVCNDHQRKSQCEC